MLVHFTLLLIFTGYIVASSADALTAAPTPTTMPTPMPTPNPPTDLMPTHHTLTNDLLPTQTADVWPEKECSYRDVLAHLDLDSQRYTAVRPVRNHSTPTKVYLIVAVEAILDVVEKEQKLMSRIFIKLKWKNEFVSWDPAEFCGIERVSVPSDWLWKPDIIVDERLENNADPNSYVRLYSDGRVYLKNAEMLVSTCRMNVYKFPFDTQSCNLTFASAIYRSDELELKSTYDLDKVKTRSMSVLWGEYEWDFQDFSYVVLNETYYKHQQIVYTITVKRKAVLYIVNFLLPVLFFLGLDMASFLISDSGGEKLSFKVTVLLAITVLQLILNDILPATSNRMPIIAMYCIGTFTLMLLSLFETVVVSYLLEKDSQKTEKDKDHDPKADEANEKRSKESLCFYNVHDIDGGKETIHELQSVAEEDGDLKGESHGFQAILDELRDLEKNLDVFFKSNKEDGGCRPGYWTRMATRINTAFSIFYVTTVIVFLILIFRAWSPEY